MKQAALIQIQNYDEIKGDQYSDGNGWLVFRETAAHSGQLTASLSGYDVGLWMADFPSSVVDR